MFINSPPSSTTIIPTRVVRLVNGLINVFCPPPCDVFCPPPCDVFCPPPCDVLCHIPCDVLNGLCHILCDVLCHILRHILCNILWWPILATPQLYLAFFQIVLVALQLFLAGLQVVPATFKFLLTRLQLVLTLFQLLGTGSVFQIFDLFFQFLLLSSPRQDNIPIRVNLWSNKTRQLDTIQHILFGSR